MATGEQPSPLKNKKVGSSSTRSRNDSDNQWLLLPNNLELGARAKPSKKQRNKEKHKHFQKENLAMSEVADGLSCKADSFHNFPQVKCNATWLKDQFTSDDKSKRRAYDSEEISDSDLPQPYQQNVNFPGNQTFSDVEHQGHHSHVSQCAVDNESMKSVKDELKKTETAVVCKILDHIQDFISKAESSWQQLDLSDEPIITDALVKLKNAVKDIEGDRENKLFLQHLTTENGFNNGVSPSSSASIVSNSKENIVNRETSVNVVHCNEDGQEKCNHLHDLKVSEEKGESSSSEDSSIADVGVKVAAVQWERRKLKNKLVELHEEKKMKDELLRELCYLKDAAAIASSITPFERSKEKKKRHPRSSTSIKRDNVRKEQNSAFPARRHYEAEGRANEDPDIPAVSGPIPSVVDTPEIQDKIRKLKVAQEHVKVLKDIVASILESRKSGSHIPVEKLHLLAPLQPPNQYFSDDDSEDEIERGREYSQAMNSGTSESAVTNVKEISSDALKSALDGDSHKLEDAEQITPGKLESVVGKKSDLAKLQSQFQQLMQVFPTSDRKNDDPVRSSGEGAYTQKKNPSNVVPENVKKIPCLRSVPMQDNLQLTRQNVVTIETQNQNSNSNLHNRDCNSVKKDNINNLSGKVGKLCLQNSMNSSYPDMTGSNNNVDAMSSFSFELNQNHSLPNEVERKTIFDILKQDKKKQKQYERNQDSKICCNSSIDSEPLESSNSALAHDPTAAVAWCGSSTQEFEDENEHAESIDQDDEENTLVFDKGSLKTHGSASQYSCRYSNMRHYMESVANISDKRQRNFHPLYNRNQNHPVVESDCQQHPVRASKSSRPAHSPNIDAELIRDPRNTSSCLADSNEHCNQHPSHKFMQQLKNHIDQINTLCQSQILHERSQTSVSCPPSYRLFNTCTPFHHTSDVGLPSNQQLLLCLSQCYHTLYIQQLEIQHLQCCMWHNLDSENQQQNNLNSQNNIEDPSFRPYSVPTWTNPFVPSNHFPSDMSPISPAAYCNLPMKSYTSQSNGAYGSIHGAQPARAVIHPTSQNNIASQETLNNQVPPRTRANNFWDNFRSYSRQNLLSTSNNNKRNENVGSVITPQVRQVYPLVSNDNSNRGSDISNAYGNISSFTDYNRLASVSHMQGGVNFPKKAKSNTYSTSTSNCFPKKDIPSDVGYYGFENSRSNKFQSQYMEPVSNSSNNLIQLHPIQDNSKVSSSAPCQSSIHQIVQESSVPSATSELSGMLSEEYQSDFFSGLFYEIQSLKSDALRQKALGVIRDLAKSENHDNESALQVKSHSHGIHDTISGSNTRTLSVEPSTSATVEVNDIEKTQVPSDNASGSVQNLPTAAIQPLSKHGTLRSTCTGAVRKKPKIPATYVSCIASNNVASCDSGPSTTENSDPTTVISQNKAVEDIPGFIAEKVLSDIAAMLPSLKRRLLRDSCSQTFWTFINDCLIESLRNHLFYCNIILSRKTLLHLRQNVYLFISLFSGISLSNFDSDFLKYVEEFVYDNISCFIANGQFPPVPTSVDEENCSLGIEDKLLELDIKMPIDHNDQMKELSIKMPSEESDAFSLQCRTTSRQNLLQSLLNYDSFLPEPAVQSDDVGANTKHVVCGCNPEGEIEPEVEIGTEADLAEADQSPGQQGNVGDGLPATESWSAEQEAILIKNTGNSAVMLDDENREIENLTDGATSSQFLPDAYLDQEAILDDIPIKLCPSEEELPQQLKDEQSIQLPSEDINSQNEFNSESSGDGAPSNMK